jgi:hypothetical protein
VPSLYASFSLLLHPAAGHHPDRRNHPYPWCRVGDSIFSAENQFGVRVVLGGANFTYDIFLTRRPVGRVCRFEDVETIPKFQHHTYPGSNNFVQFGTLSEVAPFSAVENCCFSPPCFLLLVREPRPRRHVLAIGACFGVKTSSWRCQDPRQWGCVVIMRKDLKFPKIAAYLSTSAKCQVLWRRSVRAAMESLKNGLGAMRNASLCFYSHHHPHVCRLKLSALTTRRHVE